MFSIPSPSLMLRWGEAPRWDCQGARPWRAVVRHSSPTALKESGPARHAGLLWAAAPTRSSRRPVTAAATNSRPFGLLINPPFGNFDCCALLCTAPATDPTETSDDPIL